MCFNNHRFRRESRLSSADKPTTRNFTQILSSVKSLPSISHHEIDPRVQTTHHFTQHNNKSHISKLKKPETRLSSWLPTMVFIPGPTTKQHHLKIPKVPCTFTKNTLQNFFFCGFHSSVSSPCHRHSHSHSHSTLRYWWWCF